MSDFARAIRGEIFEVDNSLKAVLLRGADNFRRGSFCMGSCSFQVYLESKERKNDDFILEISTCINTGDYHRAADVIEFGIVPTL